MSKNTSKIFCLIPIRSHNGSERFLAGSKTTPFIGKLFAEEHNFLVLDEPTNDLDMETLELLQEVIADYKGTILIISHDRDFIDRTVTSLLAFEGDGKVSPTLAGILIIWRGVSKPLNEKKPNLASLPRKQNATVMPEQRNFHLKTNMRWKNCRSELAALETAIEQAEKEAG